MNKQQRDRAIKQLYISGKYTTEYIAKTYGITSRQVQRIALNGGYVRTQAEANKLIAPLKNYRTIPIELRVKRKQLSNKLRYELISKQPYCLICGMRPSTGARLEVDHIDNNPSNNELSNLQVLCTLCNKGKSHSNRDN